MNNHPKNKVVFFLTLIFVFSFAFDFKGEAGGTLIQYVMAVLNFLAFVLLAIYYRFRIRNNHIILFSIFGWIIFLLVGSLGAFYFQVPFGVYGRAIYPFILFAEGVLVAHWVSKDVHYSSSFMEIVIFSSIISLFFTFVWGIYFTGKSLVEIRYSILSPSISFLTTAMCFDLFISGFRRVRAFLLLTVAIVFLIISQTRGMLLSIWLPFIVVMIAWVVNSIRSKKVVFPKVWLRGILIAGLFGIIFLGVFYIISPLFLDLWIIRLIGEGNLVTLWSRIGAAMDQWDQLIKQPVAWFVGRGFGQSYNYSKEIIRFVYPHMDINSFYMGMTYPAEFMWMSLFFYGGFFNGFVATCVLLLGMVLSFRAILNFSNFEGQHFFHSRDLWISVLGYFALVGLTITSNPFVLRQTGLLFGLLLGIVITNHIRLKKGLYINEMK